MNGFQSDVILHGFFYCILDVKIFHIKPMTVKPTWFRIIVHDYLKIPMKPLLFVVINAIRLEKMSVQFFAHPVYIQLQLVCSGT